MGGAMRGLTGRPARLILRLITAFLLTFPGILFMRRLLACGVLLSVAVLAFPGPVAGQKKKMKKDDDVERGTPQEYAQLRQLSQVAGKLAFAEAGSKVLALRIEYDTLEPRDPDELQPNRNPQSPVQSLLRQQYRVLRTTNPIQRQREMQRLLLQAQRMKLRAAPGGPNSPFRLVKKSKEYEFEVKDRASVRRLTLPVDYDDKGFLKTYSKEELAKLRGTNPQVPGYAAKYEDLQAGQTVVLYLAPAAKADKKSKEEKGEEGVGNVLRPVVRMIVIQSEAPDPSMSPGAGLPKKKK